LQVQFFAKVKSIYKNPVLAQASRRVFIGIFSVLALI